MAERPACDGVVPGSIPGLAFSFSSYSADGSSCMHDAVMIGVHLTHVATHYQPHRMTRVATTGVANAWNVGPFFKPCSGVPATLMSFHFFGIWADLFIMVILFAIFVVSVVSINPTWNPRAATFLIVAAGFDTVQSRCGCSGLILYRGQPIKVKVKAKSHPHPHPHGFDEVRTSPKHHSKFQIRRFGRKK